MGRKRVIVAMSGGVDSSTAAALLVRQGHEVSGVTMRLWTPENPDALVDFRRCCSPQEIEDARTVCQALGIPHRVLNFEREFASAVVDYFCQEYLRGHTPNPCLACNQHIKFRLLLPKALALGADYLATGHYCRIISGDHGHELWRARDEGKDQSYVLYMLGQEELARLLFPLGDYTKGEVRRMAAEMGLPVASKTDSADICFLPRGGYRAFLAERFPQRPGDIVDSDGRIVGRHEGIAGYTVGQRRGLPARGGREPLYVLSLDPLTNSVIAGSEHELLSDVLWADKLSFVSGQGPPEPLAVEAKIRYRSQAAAALLALHDGRAEVRFERPQRAITPGQAVVFYQGEKVLGGGIIAESAG
ncbi:MAG: tRNA 2-thiouridine(34) synthase MnmA [Dehalococcoidia bacterium]|nr:tRNA 2-thiouridine(34) synthase MnmA [Dehalococcoidia bacterium]